MGLGLIAFRQVTIMLILMLVGILCAKTNMIDEHANNKLSSVLLYLVTPAVIFMSFQRPLEADLVRGLGLAFLLTILTFAFTITFSNFIYKNRPDGRKQVEIFGSVYSNSGFIGLPLVYGVFGSDGVFYISAWIVFSSSMNWLHGVMVMSGENSFAFIRKALLTPPILTTLTGLVFFFLQIQLPEILLAPVGMIRDLNTPLAMIIAGVTLVNANVKKVVSNINIYKYCFIRLIVIPFIVLMTFNQFNIDPLIRGVIVVAAGCPAAVVTILFAKRYDKDHLYASELVVSSTVISLITLPILLFFV